jgi:hypothetical protein
LVIFLRFLYFFVIKIDLYFECVKSQETPGVTVVVTPGGVRHYRKYFVWNRSYRP